MLTAPPLGGNECEWARTGARPAPPGVWPSVTDVTSDPMQDPLRRMPWDAPVWNAGENGVQFVPSLFRQHVDFWHDTILPDHPLKDTLVSYLCEGVGVQDLLQHEYRGPSVDCPYDVGRFPGAVFLNRIPLSFAGVMGAEVQALLGRGCVVK